MDELDQTDLVLLSLLKKQDREQGIFFARWDEIDRSNLPSTWLKSVEGAPNLDWQTERQLGKLIDLGHVEELEQLGTDQGKNFRITWRGLEVLRNQSAGTSRIPEIAKLLRGKVFGIALAVVIAFAATVTWLLQLPTESPACEWINNSPILGESTGWFGICGESALN